MFDKEIYVKRREALKKSVGSGLLLFLGNDEAPCNYEDNTYSYRQDSSFLYFFGQSYAGLNAVIDIDNDREIIFGDELSIDHIVWMGNQPTIHEKAACAGISDTRPSSGLRPYLDAARAAGQRVHYLPPYRNAHCLRLWELLDVKPGAEQPSVDMISAVVDLRNHKQFATIATVNGQTLHNHCHSNIISEGNMLLVDAGAETAMGYAGDMSSTICAGKRFTDRQKLIYDIQVAAHLAAVSDLRPGVPFVEVYEHSARVICDALKGLGIMKGDPAEAVAAGAHAMFFPCGLGHMMGLDVHDMENLGEVYVGYDGKPKSTQFGRKSLRLGRPLEPGFVLTIEPGVYFIPELIDYWGAEKRFADFIDYAELNKWRDFGGIRNEEDYLITADGARRLGKKIPLTTDEVEALR